MSISTAKAAMNRAVVGRMTWRDNRFNAVDFLLSARWERGGSPGNGAPSRINRSTIGHKVLRLYFGQMICTILENAPGEQNCEKNCKIRGLQRQSPRDDSARLPAACYCGSEAASASSCCCCRVRRNTSTTLANRKIMLIMVVLMPSPPALAGWVSRSPREAPRGRVRM